MLRRELAIVLRAPATWTVAAIVAVLVGHGLLLAVDLFASASRSVESLGLMARELDPLSGVVRPMLGGLALGASLLAPAIGARTLAIEKERGSLAQLLLAEGSAARVTLAAYAASLAGAALLAVGPLVALACWLFSGGHLATAETGVALLGHALHVAALVAMGLCAGALSGSVAQATALALVVVLGSWAIDAAEGFAALAWLGGAARWSIGSHLASFEHGVLCLGDIAWLAALAATALGLAVVGVDVGAARPERSRAARAALVLAVGLGALALAGRWERSFDLTETERASLPEPIEVALRAIDAPIVIELYLDRDDSRRRQLESDALAKLRIARPDLVVRAPLDERAAPELGATHDDGYGRIVVRVGDRSTETHSASRRELVTLIFELADVPMPAWEYPSYPGYPHVVEGGARDAVAFVVYVATPGALLGVAAWIGRRRRRG